MKALRAVLVTLMTLAVLTATSYGAGFAVRHYESRTAGPTVAAEPTGTPDAATATPSPSATDDPTPAPEPTPSAAPVPEDVLSPGDRGADVRELQARLFQLAWLPELTTGRYDATTRAAVAGFQGKRGLEATGVVDPRTWKRLVTMTEQPTHDQLFNVLHPGPAILDAGDTGDGVRDLQARLVATQWLFGDVSGTFDSSTVEAVEGFQAKRGIPVTGAVDQRTMDRLHAMTSTPTHAAMYNLGNQAGALDARCRTGRALCIDKTSQTLRWVVDGQVRQTLDVRFGASYSPTREGLFHVSYKDADHVSNLYGSEMPYSMFFSGGQAVHYSSDFAARGYAGASHGCVNVRDYAGLAHLFDEVGVGDKVVVYWS
ncbi:peptidoglycan-binding protein [Nocardioides sp. KIGAM211]|uniref:Peptidoglycan-binding protein n=1 Tax=Nocardioides luti TaxID=2761101 RepID=A0A7X0RFI0_9ACTN|nr:peptidoglycan-binding protein [Nocardioides luti]MBB6627361.1 peptidoglycan-binding protein [Nocardioides luti]